MPVLDHDVHPSTQHGPDYRYGCWNRDRKADGYLSPNRIYTPSGNYILEKKWIHDAMSRECRYDMSLTDANCAECKHRGSGEAYDKRIREQGK